MPLACDVPHACSTHAHVWVVRLSCPDRTIFFVVRLLWLPHLHALLLPRPTDLIRRISPRWRTWARP
jgi:hypothetical protein